MASVAWRQDPKAVLRGLLGLEPKLLILDEALSGLDAASRAPLLDLLRTAQQELGLTYLYLTRWLELARELADEIVVRCRGRIVETGEAARLLDSPRHPHTQSLAAAPSSAARAEGLHARRRDEAISQGAAAGCRFQARCPKTLPRCATEEPALFAVPGGLSRCFLSEPEGSEA